MRSANFLKCLISKEVGGQALFNDRGIVFRF